jgi:serine/threonine protein kinase
MSPSSDRNFLFALVAYQNGYVTMEQFFEASQVWNRDPKLDIGSILVERRFLEEVERFNIQGIVEDRLRRQGGLDNSLSFVVENGSMPEGQDLPEDWQKRIEQITNIIPEGMGSRRAMGAGRDLKDLNKPSSPSIHRYVFRKPIGEGGQGIVWEVDDTELGRRIALKRVHPKHANDPLHSGMLIEESRNTGRLEHAGIVPVYDLGQDDEGNPFFTMQLIRGEKLSDWVKAIRYESLGRDSMVNQIRPLLRHLIAACNTLQYAYDKCKVIHRDVKPENIMVNRYGETVVMDWGMGKAVEDTSQLDEASSMLFVPVSGTAGGVDKTLVGSVKGTLGYLSPEQALAMNMALDHRTDIYGLGATLYRILTGTVPHSGTNLQEALGRAKLNQFVRPRDRNSRVPRELEAICLKAMATLPSDRYQKATDMGQDLENWLVGEPISVVPDHLFRKSERWLRKHAKGVIASLLLLGLTAAALLWATVASVQKTQKLNIANSDLVAQQNITKESRDSLSFILDDVVGYIFDDQMSQKPDFETTRIGMLTAVVDVMEVYVSKHPDDWDLKLDLVRLLTRLANLEQYKDPGSVEKTFQRASELVGQAANAPDSKLERPDWLKASIDKELYEGDFQFQIKGNSPIATRINQRAFDLAEALSGIEGESQSLYVIRARLHAQKSSILLDQDRLEESLAEATLGGEQVAKAFPSGMLTTGLSAEQIDRIDYGDILIYLTSLNQRCSVLKKLELRDDYRKSLRQMLSCAEIGREVSNAQRDARVFGVRALRELHRISLFEGQDSQASKWYEETSEWIEQADGDPGVLEEALVLESDRAMSLAARDLAQAKESLLKGASYLEALKPQEEQQDDYDRIRYLDNQIVYNESALAVLLAAGDLQEHQKLRDKQTECEHERALLDAKLSGQELKE